MISPLAYVDPTARLGKDVKIHPFAFIDGNVEIGDGCEILPYASIVNGTRMGANNKVYQGAIIGADPQDFRWKGQQTYCYIGDNNTFREHVIVNRGIYAEGGTRIGNDVFVMAESHIGHDSVIEGRSVLGNAVAVAGDTVIGECTILSSAVIVHEGCKVGKWVLVKGGCRIGSNVPPYTIMAHNPTAYYGVNAVIMRRKGFTDEQIDEAAKCYRHVYQSGTSVFNAIRRIEADVEDPEIRDAVVNFIRSVNFKIVALPLDLND
ncbi:MAG: acyl-ACP--UDP-N-acetylglucosamine O-acyltransferase [Muribaculaceae bacterium]|nr:acyl-ACP--UDP-N-acetylglucosamine O-acyltransferase [Muribaculaceae bacterium]